MKRHAALQDLSRDHFLALGACLDVRRAAEGSPPARPIAEVRAAFLHLVRGDLVLHCEEENVLLLPLLDASGARLAARLREEHAGLKERFARLDDDAPMGALAGAAEALRAHVRWEEDELFPWLQEHVDLDGVGDASRAFRLAHRGPAAVGPDRPT